MTHWRKLRTAMALGAIAILASGSAAAADYWMYAGTYTSGGSKGIYAWRFQAASGKASPAGLAAATANPSFLVVPPNHQVLFAVNENGSDTVMGSVSAFSVDSKSGKL